MHNDRIIIDRVDDEEDLELMFLKEDPKVFYYMEKKDPEEFLNETVDHGRVITLLLKNRTQITGNYDKTIDDKGNICAVLRSNVNKSVILFVPVDDISTWYYVDDRMIKLR